MNAKGIGSGIKDTDCHCIKSQFRILIIDPSTTFRRNWNINRFLSPGNRLRPVRTGA